MRSVPSPAALRRAADVAAEAASIERAATIEECAYIQMTTSIVRADAPADAEPRAVVGVGVNDCDAFVATVRIAEIVEVLGINGSVAL